MNEWLLVLAANCVLVSGANRATDPLEMPTADVLTPTVIAANELKLRQSVLMPQKCKVFK